MEKRMTSRQRLIDATLTLLGQTGYRGTTTKAIAAEAGLSEVTLFRQYGSKAELVTAALEDASRSFQAAIRSPTDDPIADLTALAAGYAAFVDARPALVDRVLPEIAGEVEIGNAARSILADNVAAVVGMVKHHQTAGRLIDAPAAELVRAFMGPLLARAALRNLLPPGTFDAAAYTARFLAGYGTRA
jgi:AcrR family transcriptional regulator